MKLYIARAEFEYEGFHILGVYTTSDGAKNVIEADKSISVDMYSIEEIELDKDYLGSDYLDRTIYDVRVK